MADFGKRNPPSENAEARSKQGRTGNKCSFFVRASEIFAENLQILLAKSYEISVKLILSFAIVFCISDNRFFKS